MSAGTAAEAGFLPGILLYLYEDLRYASVHATREVDLERAIQLFSGAKLTPNVVRLDPNEAHRKAS